MIGLGTIVNTAAVIAGGACGLLLKKGINERIQETLMKALGTATIFIGISGAMTGMLALKDGQFETTGTMLMIFSLAIGAVLGEILRIEDRMESLGERLRLMFRVKEGQGFVDGFLTNALVICIGAMAIVGAIQDGMLGDPSMLYAKAILDAMISMVFASTLGIVVLFAAIPLFFYQGGLTLLAGFVAPYLTENLIADLSYIGSILICLVGINLLFGKQVRVGNLLPALLIPIIYAAFSALRPF